MIQCQPYIKMLNKPSPVVNLDSVSDSNEMLQNFASKNFTDNVIPIFDSEALKEAEKRIINRQSKEQIKAFITADKELLQQYYNLRHQVYCVENGWKDFNSAENELDHKGKIIVAVRDGKVIGGMRLLNSSQVDCFPNEEAGTEFMFRTFLKNVGLDCEAKISEVSAFFVEKESRDSTVSTMLFDVAFREAEQQKCLYTIGISTVALCRSHRKDINRLGYDVKIFSNYPWIPKKEYNYKKSCPIVMFLHPKPEGI